MCKKIVKNLICAVIVLYKPKENELENILTYIDNVDKCLIIDNSEIDNTAMIEKVLFRYLKKIDYQLEEKNIGLCAALNKGLWYASLHKYDWILTMNSDSSFANDIITVYKKYLASHSIDNILLLAPQYNFDRHHVKPKDYYKDVTWVMMSGNMVSVSNAIKIGTYKEEFFVDGLDCEFCLRGKKNGLRIIECGNAILNHMPAETKILKIFGFNFKYGIASPLRYYYQSRSTWWIFRKYHSVSMIKIMIVKFLKIVLLFNRKKEYLQMYKKGIKDSYNIPL